MSMGQCNLAEIVHLMEMHWVCQVHEELHGKATSGSAWYPMLLHAQQKSH